MASILELVQSGRDKTRFKVLIACDYCGDEFWRKFSDYKRTREHYCSQACYALEAKRKRELKSRPNQQLSTGVWK